MPPPTQLSLSPQPWLYNVVRCDYAETALAKVLADAGANNWELASLTEVKDLVNFRVPAGWLLTFKKPA